MTASWRRRLTWLFLGILASSAVGATTYTGTEQGVTDWLGAVSVYAAGIGGMVLVLGSGYFMDWAAIGVFDTWQELADGNRAVAEFWKGLLIAFAIIFFGAMSAVGQPTAHVDTAERYVGVTERPPGSNAGPAVERFLRVVDLGPGYPYCAAAASAWLKWAGVEGPEEDGRPIRSALATDFLDARCVIDAGDVLHGRKEVPSGAVAVWRKGNRRFGHTGPVKRWNGRCGVTIEANTTPPDDDGNQREGQGVYERRRCLQPHSYFRIVGFALPDCSA